MSERPYLDRLDKCQTRGDLRAQVERALKDPRAYMGFDAMPNEGWTRFSRLPRPVQMGEAFPDAMKTLYVDFAMAALRIWEAEGRVGQAPPTDKADSQQGILTILKWCTEKPEATGNVDDSESKMPTEQLWGQCGNLYFKTLPGEKYADERRDLSALVTEWMVNPAYRERILSLIKDLDIKQWPFAGSRLRPRWNEPKDRPAVALVAIAFYRACAAGPDLPDLAVEAQCGKVKKSEFGHRGIKAILAQVKQYLQEGQPEGTPHKLDPPDNAIILAYQAWEQQREKQPSLKRPSYSQIARCLEANTETTGVERISKQAVGERVKKLMKAGLVPKDEKESKSTRYQSPDNESGNRLVHMSNEQFADMQGDGRTRKRL